MNAPSNPFSRKKYRSDLYLIVDQSHGKCLCLKTYLKTYPVLCYQGKQARYLVQLFRNRYTNIRSPYRYLYQSHQIQ